MKQLFSILMCLQLLLLPLPAAHAKEGGGGSSTNQILALGTGIIGSNILLDCSAGYATPSIMTFFGGSLVYIGSEIFGAKAQQAFIKVKKDEIYQLKLTMAEGGDLQKGIIDAKLKEEEEKLSFVKKRKQWMTAVATIYTAATALAVVEMICINAVFTSVTCPQWFMAGCSGSSLPSNQLLKMAVLGAYGFGTSSAGGGAISTYGTLLYAGLGLMVDGLSSTISVAYQRPETRIATFGAGTALSYMVVSELSGIEKDLESNVEDLKKLSADFKAKTQDVNGMDSALPGAVDLASDNINKMQGAGNVNRMAIGEDLNKHCWGKDSTGKQTYSPDVCNNSLKLTKPKFNSKFNLPTLQSVANTGTDMAQAVANGDMAAADLAAANLASNAMRVKEIQDNLLKQLNDHNKKAGKKPYDFEKEVGRTLASMKSHLKNNGATGGSNLAGFGSQVPSSSSLDAKPSDEMYQDIKTSESDEAISADAAQDGMFDINEGSYGASDSFDIGDGALAESHSLEDFETQESDILAKPEESIFKQLSNRYLLNYSKIFETKAPTQAETK